ncbi:unnamed protein product [Rotaria sp. Silwood2]|nr:unnamed protein product [Rotaria sp. Silwood2]CAF4821072.1 unnamed protein product [Rotaria sp. Silwood2]
MNDLGYLRPFVAQRDKIIFVAFGINSRFPCPCTLRQAQVDTRFGRLFSETQYENGQDDFSDQCCSPSHITGRPDWELCYLYYQLHPPSSCTGYRPLAIVTGVGDPHVNTIDDGRYTCHIQGLFVFAQTTTKA